MADLGEPNVDDRREIAGWLMYDWANSAFSTTVITVLIGPYLTALAQQDVGQNGVVLALGPLGSVTATSLFPYCIAASVFLQVLLLPLLGAIADYSQAKKRLMIAFCYTGVAATCLLFFVTGQRYLIGGLLLIVANLSFGVTIVLYNAYLNDITSAARRDRVSSQGYAAGYLGGGLLLAANLALVSLSETLGISLGAVWRRLHGLPHTRRYLVAYMAFNDAIQTVISIASVFLAQELFVARGLPVSESFLIGLVLMVQFVAFGGALLFEGVGAAVATAGATAGAPRAPRRGSRRSSRRRRRFSSRW